MSMGDGKAINVIEYLDNLIEKGKATNGAIRPLKIAFTKVMQVIEGEEWERADVRTIDVNDYMSRFGILTMGKYASDSLTVYKSRVNKAISWYLQFLDKPGWTPEVQRRDRSQKKVASSVKPANRIQGHQNSAGDAPVNPAQQSAVLNTKDRIVYPYPLSSGEIVQFSLPTILLKKDAKRIASFIESIAMDGDHDE
jgi:hypothetical protein